MKSVIVLLLLAITINSHTQVKISSGGGEPASSAGLDVDFTDRGFLPPRLSTAQRDNIQDPVIGLMILNTDISCIEYYRGNGNWYSMCPKLPTVTTLSVTSVTGTSAECGGQISEDGGSTITSRGVCWSTSPEPTISDQTTSDGLGIGSFMSQLTSLQLGTTYYVRAYATNSIGTAYGNEISFTTLDIPQLTTATATNIFGKNATTGGSIISDGGTTVTSRGICWSSSPGPTSSDNTVPAGSGMGIFTAIISGLSYSTTYYARAFAANAAGTAYGNEISFTTNTGTLVSFTSVGNHNWSIPAGVESVEYLIVGGGGGAGGNHAGGGGGGGGVRYGETTISGTATITVGGGGSGGVSGIGQNGQSSSINSIVAAGGGGGGSEVSGNIPTAGGSGGGGSGASSAFAANKIGAAGNTPATSPSQGNNGGNGSSTQGDGYGAAGGGGGAGAVGSNASGNTGGNGGNGIQHSITGTPAYYGGGGGGGSWQTGPGGGAVNSSGGLGGGGNGVIADSGTNGTNNLGGGGGGSGGTGSSRNGGSGGSGVVYVRY